MAMLVDFDDFLHDLELKRAAAMAVDLTPVSTSGPPSVRRSGDAQLQPARPDMKAMSHLYRRAWRGGLKTTYYLRTLGASTIEKATVTASAALGAPVTSSRPLPGPPVSAAALACSLEAARSGQECEACQ
jgi:ribonucleoside-diphosphate reductase alpha chain